jgi:Tfp pilus assembly protein PilP
MKYEKKDRTKVVVLLVVLVGIWAVVGIRFAVLTRERNVKQAARAREEAKAQATPAAAPAEARALTSPTLRLAALVKPVDPPKSDPFHPVIPPRRQVEASMAAAATPKPAARTDDEAPVLPPLPGDRNGRNTLQVTGIIVGSPSTAVLRVGDEHYVVHAGDYLDNELRVQEITKDTVTLRDGRTTYTLRLGR